MIRKTILFLTFSVLLGCLTACGSTRNYEAQLETWIGKSENDLISAWGIPDKQYQLDPHTKLISFISHSTAAYPRSSQMCFADAGLFSHCANSLPPMVQTFYCETIFTLVRGRVTRWGHKGNNCQA